MRIGLSIVSLVGSLAGLVVSTCWRSRRATRVFYRGLRRAGMSEREADALTKQYYEGLSLRGWIPRVRFGGRR